MFDHEVALHKCSYKGCACRTSYLLLLVVTFFLAFVRRPWALFAISVCVFGGLCLNDPFATSLRYIDYSPFVMRSQQQV